MPRPMYGGRLTPPISIAADVQRIINAQPTACVVKRRTSASTGKNITFAALPEFQCRIDPVRLRMSANTEGVSEAGFADANTLRPGRHLRYRHLRGHGGYPAPGRMHH